MEAVEGMLKQMQLSEMEKKGIRIGGGDPSRAKQVEPPGDRQCSGRKTSERGGTSRSTGQDLVPDQGSLCVEILGTTISSSLSSRRRASDVH